MIFEQTLFLIDLSGIKSSLVYYLNLLELLFSGWFVTSLEEDKKKILHSEVRSIVPRHAVVKPRKLLSSTCNVSNIFLAPMHSSRAASCWPKHETSHNLR